MTVPTNPTATAAQLEDELRVLRRWLKRNHKKEPSPTLLNSAETRFKTVKELTALKEKVSGGKSRSGLAEQYEMYVAEVKAQLQQNEGSQPIAEPILDQAGTASTDGFASEASLGGHERRIVQVADLRPNVFNATIFVDSLSPEGIEALAEDVTAKGGIVYPIQVAADGVTIIDGERRYRALLAAGIEQVEVVVRSEISTEDQVAEFVLTDHGTHRRATVREQVNLFEAWLDRLTKSSRVENLGDPEAKPRDVAAKRAGFSSYGIANKAQKVLAEADEQTVANLASGELSISGAYDHHRKICRIEKDGGTELRAAFEAGEFDVDEAIERLDADQVAAKEQPTKVPSENPVEPGEPAIESLPAPPEPEPDSKAQSVATEATEANGKASARPKAEDAFKRLLDALCEHVAGTKKPLTTMLVRLATERLQSLLAKEAPRG